MIVDMHIHLGSMVATPCVDNSLGGVLDLMDHLQIDVAISANSAILGGRAEPAFETALAAYEQSAGRVLSYAYFNPHYADEDLAWARRSLAHAAFVGIKIHPPTVECAADDPRWEPAWRLAAEAGVPLLSHSWVLSDYNPRQRYAVPELFETYVRAYPEVNLILGHTGGRHEGHLAAARLAQAYPNVYGDLSGDSYAFGLVEWLVAEMGAERLLYGSDITMIDARTQIGRILDAEIGDEAKARIMGGNAMRLFKLEAPRGTRRTCAASRQG